MTARDPGPYDVPLAAIRDHVETLAVKLARWQLRDDNTRQPDQRQAANGALDAIDAMTRGLYLMRSRLAGEIRASDDAAAKRREAGQ